MKRRYFIVSAGLAAAAYAAYSFMAGNLLGAPSVVSQTCSYCGMKIERREFAAELVVDGRRHFYDDVGCMMIHYLSFKGVVEPVKGAKPGRVEKVLVQCFDVEEAVDASVAWFVKGSDVKTPMRHGYIAFKSLSSALEFAKKHGGEVFGWDKLVESFHRTVEHTHEEAHGEIADAFGIELKLLDGRPATVSQILRAGKPVLLVFFATWCPTCSKNITTLTKAYPHFRNKVAVLLTSFDPGDTPQEIQRFLEQHNAPSDWTVAQPNLEFLVALRVITQETIFGISAKGEIVYEKRFGTLTEDDWLNIVHRLEASR
ncbi:MAG: nitrous oxide reductase accessory protein NosL [Candidatus Caldarchaeum sp.]|nr:nitrous oxide reductase accessory protein NosL [Candidatus Caldarchaeum sp.]